MTQSNICLVSLPQIAIVSHLFWRRRHPQLRETGAPMVTTRRMSLEERTVAAALVEPPEDRSFGPPMVSARRMSSQRRIVAAAAAEHPKIVAGSIRWFTEEQGLNGYGFIPRTNLGDEHCSREEYVQFWGKRTTTTAAVTRGECHRGWFIVSGTCTSVVFSDPSEHQTQSLTTLGVACWRRRRDIQSIARHTPGR
ncbi:hypothetical protein KC19_VG226800 [Ceratodon purpureus]|uniref:Uncharacterized protein n=1 Tax=Ceratodon purpureus TaxID=3225 RepID=A0A8T0HSP0_CERPU|nr:hypothetical protein KC19_VG226800 [Ceratodon purpureus]